ncbi:DUF4139 domain-containing protein [Phenylobacterium sp.]|uniref:DUF4139 domain-containing protein n=1 Tax=Phenylobacterium sp. TaxID=1871053 RepID=UPI00356A9C97
MVGRAWRALALAAPLAAGWAGGAGAQAVSEAPSAASVTVYRDQSLSAADLGALDPSQGLALITETRTVTLPAGLSRIAFRGVADTMVPETAAVEGLPGRMVERNEDMAILSPGALVARSLGQTVRVVQTDRGDGAVSERAAVIRSGPDGVLLDFDGRIEALGCGGAPTRLVFDRTPEGLGDKPTFSVLASLPAAGRYTVRLSYLATGFSWAADYVARIRPDGRTLDLAGWLTLSNKSSAGFARAPTQVVAGDLMRDPSTRPPPVEAQAIVPDCWGQTTRYQNVPTLAAPAVQHRIEEPKPMISELMVTARARKAVLSDLGDYKLYTLPEPTTVAARQTKQVAFLDEKAVPFDRVYVYRRDPYAPRDDPDAGDAPDVVLRLQNKREFGLGKPLPAGSVSVMEPGGGGLVLAGEQQVKDTAVGLPLELTLGRAMDVRVGVRVETDTRRREVVTRALAVSIVNEKPQPAVVEYHEPRIGQDFRIAGASAPSVFKAGDEVWTFRLQPGERTELRYSLSYRD